MGDGQAGAGAEQAGAGDEQAGAGDEQAGAGDGQAGASAVAEPSEGAVSLDMFDGMDVEEFADAAALEAWLEVHHATSHGIWVRLYRARSGRPSVAFEDLLALGLCFGWSESTRRSYDTESYLQRFTPRRSRGTTSERNRRLAGRLIADGRMRPAGLAALGLPPA